MSSLMEVRSAGEAGNGCFAAPPTASTSGRGAAFIEAGATVLDNVRPLVWAVNDEHESRNCRHCLRPCLPVSSSPTPEPPSSPSPTPRNCPACQRSVLCYACLLPTTAAASSAARRVDVHGGRASSGDVCGGLAERGRRHDSQECQALTRLSALQKDQPDLAGSLLGGSTIYLRLLLQLLAMRARESNTAGRVEEEHQHQEHRQSLSDMDDLEDHLEDLLDGGEMEARMANTIQAARTVAAAAWKASQDTCAELLGKLYCNSMTIGQAGFSAPLGRRRYWSGIRGCLYADFGVGLFPTGAMFNHSCRPNCSWRTVVPTTDDDWGSSVPSLSLSSADRAGAVPLLRVVALESIPAGSQLFISYVDILQPTAVRKDLLRSHFFFECACPRCCRRGPSTGPLRARKGTPTGPCSGNREDGSGNPGSIGDTGGGSDRTLCDGGKVGVVGGGNDGSSGLVGGGGDSEELVSGGWVCPERSCCGRGRVLPPLPVAGGGVGGACGGGGGSVSGESPLELEERGNQQVLGDEGRVGEERGTEGEEADRTGRREDENGWASLRGRCVDCGGRTEQGYFDRWTDLLRGRLAAADVDMASGRVRKGRRGLAAVQAICDRRLAPHHAFSLGVHSRLSLAAAVAQDWPATVTHAERALACMQGLLARVGATVAPGTNGGGDSGGADRVGANHCRRGRKRGRDGGSNRGGRSGDDASGLGGSSTAGNLPPDICRAGEAGDGPLQASAIWEAILVEVLDRALPLAGRGHEKMTEPHRSRVRSAERAASVLGLERRSLATLM
ncbi:unnamed protein product [Scytosiphon promiscuus]